MAKTPELSWRVLLEDDQWDESSPVPAGDNANLMQEKAALSAGKRAIQLTGLLLVLLLILGYALWEVGQATASPEQTRIVQPPPMSVDALAANARRLVLTEHLRISANGVDIALVAATAEEMDALYRRLFSAVGLPLMHGQDAPDGRLFVIVAGSGAPDWDVRRGQVNLPSTAQIALPAEGNEKAALLQGWALALVDQAVRETGTAHQIPPHWLPLLSGLRLWLVQEAGGPLADGWGDVTSRLYGAEGGHLSPAEVEVLCARYAAWDFSSLDFALPLGCSPSDGLSPHHHAARLQLAGLGLPAWDKNRPIGTLSTARRLAVALCLEYTVETYGREQLPQLLGALGRHNSWETLFPEVFGVGAEQFEAGCQDSAREEP